MLSWLEPHAGLLCKPFSMRLLEEEEEDQPPGLDGSPVSTSESRSGSLCSGKSGPAMLVGPWSVTLMSSRTLDPPSKGN